MTKYKLDRPAFEEHVLNAPWMVREMEQRAQRGYEFAAGVAPERTGEYKTSFVITSGTHGMPDSEGRKRAYAELLNVAEDAGYVEFGNGHEGTAQHVLLRAMDVMGA